MKDLALITNKEAVELGNRAFRRIKINHKHKDIYISKKWKLHLFQDKKGNTEKIAIVDEQKPLLHIDNLWSKKIEIYTNDDSSPVPRYNFVEITKDLVIYHHIKFSIDLMLEPESQYHIFTWLEQNGFLGETYEAK